MQRCALCYCNLLCLGRLARCPWYTLRTIKNQSKNQSGHALAGQFKVDLLTLAIKLNLFRSLIADGALVSVQASVTATYLAVMTSLSRGSNIYTASSRKSQNDSSERPL
jgi:hypothetical protein